MLDYQKCVFYIPVACSYGGVLKEEERLKDNEDETQNKGPSELAGSRTVWTEFIFDFQGDVDYISETKDWTT